MPKQKIEPQASAKVLAEISIWVKLSFLNDSYLVIQYFFSLQSAQESRKSASGCTILFLALLLAGPRKHFLESRLLLCAFRR